MRCKHKRFAEHCPHCREEASVPPSCSAAEQEWMDAPLGPFMNSDQTQTNTCNHIIAYADGRHAHPCPVCELEKRDNEHKHLSDALVGLKTEIVDIELPLLELLEETQKTIATLDERIKSLGKSVFAIQERHGHLRPSNAASGRPEDRP